MAKLSPKQIKYFGTARQKAALRAKRSKNTKRATKKTVRRRAAHNPRKRVNCGDSFPVGQMVPVEAVRVNKDGTINVIVRDSEMPRSMLSTPGAMNRKRRNSGPKTYDIQRSLGRGDWEGIFSVEARTKKQAIALAKSRLAGGSYSRGKIRAVPQ